MRKQSGPTDHSLDKLLPHQLANQSEPLLRAFFYKLLIKTILNFVMGSGLRAGMCTVGFSLAA